MYRSQGHNASSLTLVYMCLITQFISFWGFVYFVAKLVLLFHICNLIFTFSIWLIGTIINIARAIHKCLMLFGGFVEDQWILNSTIG